MSPNFGKQKLLGICTAVFILFFANQPLSLVGQQLAEGEISIDRLRLGETDWHGLYIAGQKSGYLSSKVERQEVNGDPVFVLTDSFVLRLVSLEQKVEMKVSQRMEFSSTKPYSLLRGSQTMNDGSSDMKVDAEVQGKTLNAIITAAGEERTQTLKDFSYTLVDAARLQLWDFESSKIGDKIEFDEFDIGELEFDRQTFVLDKVKNTTAGGVPVKFFEAKGSSKKQGNLGRYRFDEYGTLLSARIAGFFEMRKETADTAKDLSYSADLFVLGTLKINRPIGHPTELKSLEVKVNEALSDAASIGPNQATETRGDDFVLILGTGAGTKVAATESELKENLEETVELPVKHPEVVRLTKEVIGDETDPKKKVQLLIPFVSNYIEDSYTSNAFSVLQILQSRKGDCTEHSMLFATMARAARIPSREVSGFIYMGDDTKAFGAHAWNEVVLDGNWVPVDATWNEFEVNPTHIQIKKTSEVQMLTLRTRMKLIKAEKK